MRFSCLERVKVICGLLDTHFYPIRLYRCWLPICVITFSAHVHLPPLSHSTTNSPRSQQGTTCSSVPFRPLPAYVVLHLRLSYVKEWALVLRLSFERPRVQQGVPLVIGCLFSSRFRLVFPLFGSPKVPLSSCTWGRKEERLV